MRRFYIIGFLVLLVFDTFAQVSFKYTGLNVPPEPTLSWVLSLFAEPWLYGAIGGYIGAFITWMTLLKYAPIGPSVAASHLELVSVTLLSVWLFNEPLDAYKLIGGLLILLGVLCLAKGEDLIGKQEQKIAQAG